MSINLYTSNYEKSTYKSNNYKDTEKDFFSYSHFANFPE